MKSYIEYCYVKSPSPRPLVVVPLGAVPPVDVPLWLIVVCTIPRAARSPPFAADVLAPRPPLTHSSAASRRDSPSPRPLVVVPLGAVPPVDVPFWLIVVCTIPRAPLGRLPSRLMCSPPGRPSLTASQLRRLPARQSVPSAARCSPARCRPPSRRPFMADCCVLACCIRWNKSDCEHHLFHLEPWCNRPRLDRLLHPRIVR